MRGSEKLKSFLTEVSAQHYLQLQLQSSLTSAKSLWQITTCSMSAKIRATNAFHDVRRFKLTKNAPNS